MALLCLSLVVVLRRAGLEPGCGLDRMIERRRTGRELIRDSIPILFLALCRTSLEQCPSTHPIFLLTISKRDTRAPHMAPPVDGDSGLLHPDFGTSSGIYDDTPAGEQLLPTLFRLIVRRVSLGIRSLGQSFMKVVG